VVEKREEGGRKRWGRRGYNVFPNIRKARHISITSLCDRLFDHHPKKGAAKKRAKLNAAETIPKNSIVPSNCESEERDMRYH
jgi:hypothetical protein